MNRISKQLEPIFYPESVALIGASTNFYKWGSFLLAGLIKGGYKGRIYPINPKEERIYGYKCHRSILDMKDPVDLAIIAVPVGYTKQVVVDCIQAGVKGIMMVTSGFSETGDKGRQLEKEIRDLIRKTDVRLIGPNTMGVINSHHDLFVTGAHSRPIRGAISLISQSGNLGNQVLQWAEKMGIGINKFIGSGNEADVNLTELLQYLHHDDSTRIILVYFEGIEDGREFLETAKRVSLDKPIIALKGGRTEAGSKAALSHTGSLAGSYQVTAGALEQAGIIIVDNPTELIDFSVAFEHLPLPQGNRVGVFTLGGGWGVIASDQCNERGFVLPELPDSVTSEMDKLLPSYWSRGNPIDLVGKMDPEIFKKAINLLATSDCFDSIIALGGLGASHFIVRLISTVRDIDPAFDSNMVQLAINEAAKLEASHLRDVGNAIAEYQKPILTVSHSEKLNYTIPIDDKIVIAYPTPEKAIRVLQAMLWYQNWKSKRTESVV